MNRIIAAATLTVALWGLKRWLDRQRVRMPQPPHNPSETWENEGGALLSPAPSASSPQSR